VTLEAKDLYAALMHELKNNLSLLSLAMERIPRQGGADHDGPLDDARLLCQQVIDKLRQALLLYKSADDTLPLEVDAYSPREFIDELRDTTASLARDRLDVVVEVADSVPQIWFFDRNLAEIALTNAIHNSLAYARKRIVIRAGMVDGMLCLTVQDDSNGYPEHILAAIEDGTPIQSGGTGLGLRLAQIIARTHTNQSRVGELRLVNDHGAGFSLLLP
jgi:signal transduction histidine kinase